MDEYSGTIEELRQVIDELDKDLISVLAERFQIVKRLSLIKQIENQPVVQNDRWDNVLSESVDFAKELSLDEDFVRKIMNDIHAESIRLQNESRLNK